MAKKKRKMHSKPPESSPTPFEMDNDIDEARLFQMLESDPAWKDQAIRHALEQSGLIDPVDLAQSEARDLVNAAYASDDYSQMVELAYEATNRFPEFSEGWLLLGELAPTPEDAVLIFREALRTAEVEMGGPDAFDRFAGKFWGVTETRPYMRAIAALSQSLWSIGDREQAIELRATALRLNPADNQGNRYVLASYYCDLGDDESLAHLLDQYESDASAEWNFSRAYLAFRLEGASEHADELLRNAHKANPYVVDYLLGNKSLPDEMPEFIQMGDVTEAVSYASQFLSGWRGTPGSITWIRTTLKVQLPESPEPRMRSWRRLAEDLCELPLQSEEVWQVDLRKTEFGAAMTGDPIWTLIATSPADDDLVVLEGYPEQKPKPQDALRELLQSLLRTTAEVDDFCRPGTIEVKKKTLHKAWQRKLDEVGIECRYRKELDHVEFVLDRLEAAGGFSHLSVDELEQRIGELSQLDQEIGEVWQADMRQLGVWLSEEGQPQRPWAALVANRSEDLILAQELMLERPSADAMWQTVMTAMLAPAASEPHLPSVIEVSDADFAETLRPMLEPLGVECELVAELDQMDFIFGHMEQSFQDPEQMAALIDIPGVTPDQIGGFFAAAANFYQAQPWKRVRSDLPIRVRCNKFQTETWYAVAMGQSGLTLGLALYDSLENLRALLTDQDEEARSNSSLSMMYGEAFEIAVRDLNAAEENEWTVAGPEAYPLVLHVNPGMSVRPPLAWELQLIEAVLRAMPAFLRREQRTPARMVVPANGEELDMELSWMPANMNDWQIT